MTNTSDNFVYSEDEYENMLLLHKPKFQKGVKMLRSKWNIPEEGFLNSRAQHDWQLKLLKTGSDQYKQDVISLMRVLELTDRWYKGVSSYIQTNAPSTLKVRPNIPVRVDYDEDGEEKHIHSIWLQVDRDTTQREIIEAFKAAQDMIGTNEDKKQKPKNLDRDLRILELQNSGMKNKQIAELLNETDDTIFNTDDIKTILKRIKHKLQ